MIMKERMLSVIVPVYNAEKYIGNCITSILQQTFHDYEIILVDDGSVDKSTDICDFYAQKYEQISVIHQENKGSNAARLTGVQNAVGEYIAFVDSDDWINKEMYQVMMNESKDCDIVSCGIYRYYNEHDIRADYLKYSEGVYEKEAIIKKIIPCMLWNKETNQWSLDPSLCSKIFRRELILKELIRVNGLQCHFGDDTAVMFPMMLHCDKITLLSKCYYYHRQRQMGDVAPYICDEAFFEKTYQVYRYLKEQFKQTEHWSVLKEQLEHFYMNAVRLKKLCYGQALDEIYPVFPFEKVCKESKVVLYGAGRVGREYKRQSEEYGYCDVVLWVDRNYANFQEEEGVKNPDEMFSLEFDYVVIALDIREAAVKVKQYLSENGVDEKKIIWHSTRVKQF